MVVEKFILRGEASLCIVTLYRPVPPISGGSPGSVYAQHMTHFSNLRRRECPRTSLLSDIAEYIKTWKNKGDQIILMGDIKE